MREQESYPVYLAFQRIPEIMGLEMQMRRNAWEGMYYITGERHAYKRDKLKVKVWAHDGRGEIVVYEQGGEAMCIHKWLVTYGGAADYAEATRILRGSYGIEVKRGFMRRESGVAVKYVAQDVHREYESYELERCPLFTWMCRLFGEKRVREVWKEYGVTTDERGRAVFWYYDAERRICYDKIMRYLENGHRDKSFGGSRRFKTAEGYTARPMYGAQLIGDSKEVYVVESEKTALLLRLESGKCVVATGGKGNLRDLDERFKLLPDMDAIEEWKEKGEVVEWWKDWAGASEKCDIGDLIVERREKK